MPVNKEAYLQIKKDLDARGIVLVAVSKTRSEEEINELYELGQRDFGENYVQEMVTKAAHLPGDIRWHFIGHLQSNKVKYIAPFVHLVQGIDSPKLLKEINKHAQKNGRTIDCLLQVFIAKEESKFGMDEKELAETMSLSGTFPNTRICGLMGMASFTEDLTIVRKEFQTLKMLFDQMQPQLVSCHSQPVLSMGMSADYLVAVEEGSTMVRIGSLLFGAREPGYHA